MEKPPATLDGARILQFERVLLGICAVFLATTPVVAGRVAWATAAAGPAAGQSRCATIDVVQRLSTIGDKISATAARGAGWTARCGPSWAWGPAMPVGTVLGGCTPDSTTCTIQVTQSTGGALGWCISNGPGGIAWGSCASYVVLDKGQGVIEGYIKTARGDPVREVVVEATGRGGSVGDVSDRSGFYVLPVSAGTYSVSATQVDTGRKAAFLPDAVSRAVKPGEIVHADFTLS
jgi:hypothetical protein